MAGYNWPCKGCEKRAEGCHSSCPEYLRLRAIKDAENRQKLLESAAQAHTCETAARTMSIARKMRRLAGRHMKKD